MSFTPSEGTLSLPISAASEAVPGGVLNVDGAVYAPVAGGSSPCSPGTASPAREVRLECKDQDGTPDPGEPSQTPQVARPIAQKALVVSLAVLSAVGVCVGAGALCRVWQEPADAASLQSRPRYRMLDNGTCADRGLEPVRSAEACSGAARQLDLKDTSAAQVPVDAGAGMPGSGVLQDCYYLVHSGKESLWFNGERPARALRSTRSSNRSPPGVSRRAICLVPAEEGGHASLLVKGNGTVMIANPWHWRPPHLPHSLPNVSVPAVPPVPHVPESMAPSFDAVKGLLLGTTTTTTATSTTTTRTWTGTSTTVTTTTVTETSTSSTSTVTSTLTATSTFTTTYHEDSTMFCFCVMQANNYEFANMRTALWKRTSIFGCDDYAVYSDTAVTIRPGKPKPGLPYLLDADGLSVKTTLLRHDLRTHPKAGALEGILNTQIFMQAWVQISEDGRFRHNDWTVKVDPDAVFLPHRLRSDLNDIAPPSSPANLYLVNCKISFGLFGAIEVFSRVALENYIAGTERCKDELDWTMMGEDLWMRRCFDLLGVNHTEDFGLLSDGYCSDAPSPCVSGKVAFHPFKSALSYLECYEEAITPTTTTTTTDPNATSSEKGNASDDGGGDDDEKHRGRGPRSGADVADRREEGGSMTAEELRAVEKDVERAERAERAAEHAERHGREGTGAAAESAGEQASIEVTDVVDVVGGTSLPTLPPMPEPAPLVPMPTLPPMLSSSDYATPAQDSWDVSMQ